MENIDGKAYLNVQSTLDEEMNVHVPILCLTPLNSLLGNQEINFEILKDQEQPTNKKEEITYQAQ